MLSRRLFRFDQHRHHPIQYMEQLVDLVILGYRSRLSRHLVLELRNRPELLSHHRRLQHHHYRQDFLDCLRDLLLPIRHLMPLQRQILNCRLGRLGSVRLGLVNQLCLRRHRRHLL